MPKFAFTPVENDPFDAGVGATEPPNPAGSFFSDLGLGLQSDVRRAIGGISGAFGALGNALTGNTNLAVAPSGAVSPIDPGLVDASNVLSGLVMEGGLAAPKPENALGVFGGVKAQTANLSTLERAKTMEKLGVNPDEIWYQTGWGKGADDQWRFEISDQGSQLYNRTGDKGVLERGALDMNLWHPELYQAYPDIRHTYVEPIDRPGGLYDPGSDLIQAPRMTYPGDISSDPHTVMLHEIQHAIQSREGFAMGGSPDDPSLLGPAIAIKQSVDQQLSDLKAKPVLNEDEASRMIYLTRIKSRLADRSLGQLGYQTLAGEVESRNVETRHGFGVGTNVSPWNTEDTPRWMQNVRILKDFIR